MQIFFSINSDSRIILELITLPTGIYKILGPNLSVIECAVEKVVPNFMSKYRKYRRFCIFLIIGVLEDTCHSQLVNKKISLALIDFSDDNQAKSRTPNTNNTDTGVNLNL